MSGPTPPGIDDNANNSGKITIQFHSAMSTKAEQKKDYFAEQNQQRAKQQAQKNKRSRLAIITITSTICLALISLMAWLVILYLQKPEPEAPIETIYFNSDTIEKDMVDLRDLANTAFDSKITENTDGELTVHGDVEAANTVFNTALSASQNQEFTSQINLSRITFYLNNGYYDLIIDYLNQIDAEKLSLIDQAAYYNAISMAYYRLCDEAKSLEYTRKAQEVQTKLGEFGG